VKLTKRKIAEARNVYDLYWESYTKGDMETFVSTLDETYEMIGTSDTEVCHTKEEGIKFYEAQMQEVVGKAELRNRQIKVVPMDQLVLINEHSNIYVMTESAWNFYSKIRISTWLRETETGWKVVQQHGSLPDMRVQEGETMAIDKISRENLELRVAVKRRTAELENKNRELEIEATLERVRAVAMSMKKPEDMLAVCRVISDELQHLGVEHIRNVQTAIIDEEKGSFLNYQYFTAYQKESIEVTEYHKNPVVNDMATRMLESADGFFTGSLAGKELEKFRAYRKQENQFPDPLLDEAESVDYHFFSIGPGGLGLTLYRSLNEEGLIIFKRFHKVFSLAYRRFRDIEKAEAQAREAQIEASLEKVRAQTMGMQSSDDLSKVASVMFEQMKSLGGDLFAFGIVLCDKDKDTVEQWHNLGNEGMISPFTVPVDLDYIHRYRYEQWKAGEELFSIEIPEDYIARHFELMFELQSVKAAMDEVAAQGIDVEIPDWEIDYGASFKHGYLLVSSRKPFKEEHIFPRFANVFEQAYTRFLDLQKAEAQAYEAQIELSLERIRAQVTAMQESSNLLDIVVTMRTEFVSLGHEAHYFWHMRWLPEHYKKAMTSGDGTRIGMVMTLPRHIHGDIEPVAAWEKSGEPTYILAMDVDTAVDYVHKMITLGDFEQVDPQAPSLDDIRHIGGLTFVMARTTHGEIGYSLPGVVPDPPTDAVDTLVRFAGVFDLAYKRFEDLKAAERQHREAQIELALERVRARTMAMQHSDELADASRVLDEQVRALGIETWGCAFHIYADNAEGDYEWFSSANGNLPFYKTPREKFFLSFYEKGQRGETFHIEEFAGEDCKAHYDFLKTLPVVGDALKALEESGIPLPDYQIDHIAFFSHGYILFITYEPVPEAHEIFRRFARVFEQTYTRFIDLQKLEAQARETQIEVALERVRARTMAMQKSDELRDASLVLFQQLKALGEPAEQLTIGIVNEAENIVEVSATLHGDVLSRTFGHSIDEPLMMRKIFEAWKEKKKTLEVKLVGEELKNYNQYRNSLLGSDVFPTNIDSDFYRISYIAFFSKGFLALSTNEVRQAESIQILERFSKAFNLTYTRFLDLQKAEAQAIEATKQASLDRVRGEIASMRSAKDLEIITPLVWNELTTLGIPFIRCGVFIVHEKEQQVEVYLSKPDGTSLAVMHLPFGASDLAIQTVDAWQKGSVYTQHWNREDFLNYGRTLIEQGQIPDLETYRGAEKAPESLHLHFIPFNQGMLYVGATELLSDEEINLAASLAEAFSIAYARYEDFIKLEKAKAGIEDALAELKATQSQLVQQEKLASLGQLTAGIAHEIKNPLNFVTNFSEVSIEMIDEVFEEVKKMEMNDTLDEMTNILSDVKANLQKINQHGVRADNIVKSMLLHSRGKSGEKIPTDLNKLLDEYVKLAYHGMRAVDKSFNIDIRTEFDNTIPKLNVVAQDISRAFLNIINNGMYAAYEYSLSENTRKPFLQILTRKVQNCVEILIKDNGGGIPDDIKARIFEPFFTTKPTGAGTGLGLSMTYDIIKLHNGSLHVDSKIGEYTEFIISLPITNGKGV
jgi:signal transduction histidine kinase